MDCDGDDTWPSAAFAAAADASSSSAVLPAEEKTCAVCFEATAWPAALPCTCRVDYCTRCWDRSLAQSFKVAGQPRCPTCRSPVRVDYDADRACLVFARESLDFQSILSDEGPPPDASREELMVWQQQQGARLEELDEARSEMIERLTKQMMPRQVQILKAYGRDNPELLEVALHTPDDAPKAAAPSLVERLATAELRRHLVQLTGSSGAAVVGVAEGSAAEHANLVALLREACRGSWGTFAAYLASSASGIGYPAPRCACGSTLKRFTGEGRARIWTEKLSGELQDSPAFQEQYAQLTRGGCCGCVCDFCYMDIKLSSATWVCESGDDTILHPGSYDVCDTCFVLHAFHEEGEALAELLRWRVD